MIVIVRTKMDIRGSVDHLIKLLTNRSNTLMYVKVYISTQNDGLLFILRVNNLLIMVRNVIGDSL